jgi:murein DD-endopeptidase MepM/ murein hydrolase activator NlpD
MQGSHAKHNKIIHAVYILFTIALILMILFFDHRKEKEDPTENIIENKKCDIRFGINLDSFQCIWGKIEKNQSLSDILKPYGVSSVSIQKIAENFKEDFNVHKIRAENEYVVILSSDSSARIRYFIYIENPVDHVILSLSDSVFVTRGQEPVSTKIRSITGNIESSLWNAMIQSGAPYALILAMEDIYAWQIDFFRIAVGDYFQVVYEERYVRDEVVGIGKIITALFKHLGTDNYAFFYNQGEKDDYFDEEAKSLRKAFLKAPLKYSRISSHFTHSRLHPILKKRRPHLGVDYAAPAGTPVYSVADGTVIMKGYQGGAGNMVKIKHNSTYTTAYLHLSGFAKGLKTGQRVKQGQLIAYVGSTGLSTGPHLDYRIWKNGRNINPLTLDFPPAKSIDSVNMGDFIEKRDSMLLMLDQISSQNL